MNAYFMALAEGWAHHAYLRSCALVQRDGDVEEALIFSLYNLWVSEWLEGM